MATHGNPKRNANGQGGVYRRADGRWEAKVFVDTPDGRRKDQRIWRQPARRSRRIGNDPRSTTARDTDCDSDFDRSRVSGNSSKRYGR
jgi:hypothetical protein